MVFVFIFFISLILLLGVVTWNYRRVSHRHADIHHDLIHHEYEPDVKEHASKVYKHVLKTGDRYAKMSLHTAVHVYRNVRDNSTILDRIKRKIRKYLYDHTPGHRKAHPTQFLGHVKNSRVDEEIV